MLDETLDWKKTIFFSFQVKLYEDFSRSKARKNIDSSVNPDEKEPQPKATGHIFQVRKIS